MIEWILGLGVVSILMTLLSMSIQPLQTKLTDLLYQCHQETDRQFIYDQLLKDLKQTTSLIELHSQAIDLYLENGSRIRYEHIGSRLSRKKNSSRRWYLNQYVQIKSLSYIPSSPSFIKLSFKASPELRVTLND